VKIDLRTSLSDALSISGGDLVSVVGAGGKTTLMYALARDLSSSGVPTLVTTTTKILYPDRSQTNSVILGAEIEATIAGIAQDFAQNRLVVAGQKEIDSKIIGYSASFVDRLHSESTERTIIAESDGAKGKSLKVPRRDEPPLAMSTTVYIVVVGADCLGKPLSSDAIFNPEMVASVAGVGMDSTVDEQVVLKAILSPESYLGRKPGQARLCVFINKVDIGAPGKPVTDGDTCRVLAALKLGLVLGSKAHVERVVFGSLGKGKGTSFLVLRE
jgi:probable selenium-dependent hydroxylase accessory protein YqeC